MKNYSFDVKTTINQYMCVFIYLLGLIPLGFMVYRNLQVQSKLSYMTFQGNH